METHWPESGDLSSKSNAAFSNETVAAAIVTTTLHSVASDPHKLVKFYYQPHFAHTETDLKDLSKPIL